MQDAGAQGFRLECVQRLLVRDLVFRCMLRT